MKNFGEQSKTHTQNDSDPQKKEPLKGRTAKGIGALITAGALAVSGGATVREVQEPHVISGNAEMSADALKNPVIYFKSNERNARIGDEATRYVDRITRDMNNHPERTKYFEDSPTEDNNDNVAGQGAFIETIQTPQGETYTFTLLSSQHGAVIEGDEVTMNRRTIENGKKIDVDVTFVKHRNKDMWSTQISESQDQHFGGVIAEANLSAAERPNQTGQALQENDNKAIMVAQEYLKAAQVGE